ncbi:MAG: DUF349 domain-containing protein, partial [Bacteroidota bacterium]|nr:DUF349 domain-containing protein [Bacteroidota bacterium]
YNYVKINKELRDLDLQKNTEKKEQLCLKAEKLLEVEDIINAHKQLQKLHDKWRETGPAYNSVKEELWERFKKPTSVINDKHQEKYKFIKEQQEKNLESKKFLCDKAEEAAGGEYKSNSDWKKASALVQKYQKLWSNIGYVPKQYNQSIYNRFSSACDSFFSGMREHFREVNEARGENLEKKKELLKQAEERKDSTDWGKETKFFKQIQSDWKNIGPVPRKHSDKIWKKFRAACNTFFENKRDFFDQRKSGEEENLELKNKLVQEILEYETQGKDEDLKKIKDFQTSWTKIGFVPLSDKDKIQEQYREAMEKLYENAGIDKSVANAMKFSDKVKALESADESRILAEIGKLRSKVEEKTKEIKLWENNMGFFADNKGSEGMKKEFTKKIENAEKEVEKFRSMIQELVNL